MSSPKIKYDTAYQNYAAKRYEVFSDNILKGMGDEEKIERLKNLVVKLSSILAEKLEEIDRLNNYIKNSNNSKTE